LGFVQSGENFPVSDIKMFPLWEILTQSRVQKHFEKILFLFTGLATGSDLRYARFTRFDECVCVIPDLDRGLDPDRENGFFIRAPIWNLERSTLLLIDPECGFYSVDPFVPHDAFVRLNKLLDS
jgi:hypothetical protein